MANNRIDTQDPVAQLFGLNARDRAIRLHLQNRLTETQFRRVVLYYGLDGGRPMSEREVAEAEDVSGPAVHYSLEQIVDKLKADAHLWVLWVLGKFFTLSDDGHGEAPERQRAADEAITSDELLELMAERGGRILDARGGEIRWESDRFHPMSPYDQEIDSLTDAYRAGEITRVEWQVGMVMAQADEQNPDGTDEARVELRQQLEWAFAGRGLGALSERECDRRVSRALRSYVNCKGGG